MYPQAVALPFLSIIAILVLITPLVLHAKNNNFPAASILVWFILLNLFNIFNSFIWPNDDIESYWNGVGLCDIEAKVMIASYVAVPGGLLCVFRSLAAVLDTRCAMLVPTKKQRWKSRGMEILFCVFVPIASMLTHMVYQRSRYMIYGITGCINDFDQSVMSLVLSFIWPPIICLIASYYCGELLVLPIYPNFPANMPSSYRPLPSPKISKPIRRDCQLFPQQPQQIPLPPPLLPHVYHAHNHPPNPMLRGLLEHKPFAPLAHLLLGRSPRAMVQPYQQSTFVRSSVLRPLGTHRGELPGVCFLWLRERCQ